MSEQEHTPSPVVPVLVAALICDVACTDPNTGKKNLIGIFDHVCARNFPTGRPVSFYLKVIDAEGYYKVEIRYIQSATGKTLAKAEGEVHAKNRLDAIDLVIPFPPLSIPEEGSYEFQVWFNSAFLATVSMRAKLQPERLP